MMLLKIEQKNQDEIRNLFHNCFNYYWSNNWRNISNNIPIMKNNVTYIWSAVVNNIARKVAAEPMENVDEEKVELIRELRKEQAQLEMFDDPVKN